MATPANQGERKTRRKESAINEIVLNATKQIRQRLIDEYWFGRLDLLTLVKDPNWKRMTQEQYLKLSKAEKVKINLMIEPIIIEENGPEKTIPGWEIESGKHTWNAYEDFHFPSSVNTNEEFAAGSGLSKSDWDEILGSRKEITVTNLINIANLGDVDPAYMLTPAADDLDADTILEHQFPNRQDIHEVRMHRWIIWIKGYAHLPEQDAKKYLQETSLAPLYIQGVEKAQAKRRSMYKKQITKQKTFKTAALNFTEETDLKRAAPDLSLDPFQYKRGEMQYETKHGAHVTMYANQMSTAQKTIISMAFRRSGNKDSFLRHLAHWHGSLIIVMKGLFGMGQK
jgi:hypothetical protein